MRWPWVSRASHEEVLGLLRDQLAKASEEVKELHRERKRLVDYIALRSGNGAPIYNEFQIPEEDETPVQPRRAPNDDSEPPAPEPIVPLAGRAREIQKRIHDENMAKALKNEAEFDRLRQISRQVETDEAAKLLREAKERGLAAAGANGTH